FFSSRRRHTRFSRDWSSDVCSSDLDGIALSADGKTIYATAQDMGEHPLFAVDVASGEATRVVAEGSIGSFSIAGPSNVFTRASRSEERRVGKECRSRGSR